MGLHGEELSKLEPEVARSRFRDIFWSISEKDPELLKQMGKYCDAREDEFDFADNVLLVEKSRNYTNAGESRAQTKTEESASSSSTENADGTSSADAGNKGGKATTGGNPGTDFGKAFNNNFKNGRAEGKIQYRGSI